MFARLMPGARWVLGCAALLGLLAMHGLTASTATAAGCGSLPATASTSHAATTHQAHDLPGGGGAPVSGDAHQSTVTAMGVGTAGGGAGGAMLCVAILLMAVVIFLASRNARGMEPVRVRQRTIGRPSLGTRAPPERAGLSVWRN